MRDLNNGFVFTIVSWNDREGIGIIKYNNGIVSWTDISIRYFTLYKNTDLSFFNEENIIKINRYCNFKVVNKTIKLEEEYDNFIQEKKKLVVEDEQFYTNKIYKYLNESGTTYILNKIKDMLEKNKIFFLAYSDLNENLNNALSWYTDCKKYFRITNNEQKELCEKIEDILDKIIINFKKTKIKVKNNHESC